MFSAFHNTHTNKHTNTHTTYKNVAKTWGLTATENKQQKPNPCAFHIPQKKGVTCTYKSLRELRFEAV